MRTDKEQSRMRRKRSGGCMSVALVGLAALGLAVTGLAACHGRGGGGEATTVQTVVSTGGAAPASSAPSVSPINDKAKLCHYLNSRGQEIVNATDAYWKLTVGGSWSWSDPNVSSAADHATEVVGKLAPLLEAAIGPAAPRDVAGAIRQFASAAEAFADGIASRSGSEELNGLNHTYMAALDAANKSCGN